MAHISIRDAYLIYPIFDASAKSLRLIAMSQALGGMLKVEAKSAVMVEALRGISLDIQDGDRVGLIGPNGAGKSTFLRMLGGIYEPSIGSVEVHGKISGLFDLSLGMDYDATGIENIRMIGAMRGLDGPQTDQLVYEVADFAALGQFLGMPIRTYSSGMATRLGFSLATAIDPEILLIDEVIGAGDQDFFKKASRRIEQLMESSRILVMASHSNHSIRTFCNKGLYLKRGRVVAYGPVEDVLKEYETS